MNVIELGYAATIIYGVYTFGNVLSGQWGIAGWVVGGIAGGAGTFVIMFLLPRAFISLSAQFKNSSFKALLTTLTGIGFIAGWCSVLTLFYMLNNRY